jgi:hypothetical protein
VILLASGLFVPIVALLIWLIVVSVRWLRTPSPGVLEPDATNIDSLATAS